jgi:hypothetical protein
MSLLLESIALFYVRYLAGERQGSSASSRKWTPNTWNRYTFLYKNVAGQGRACNKSLWWYIHGHSGLDPENVLVSAAALQGSAQTSRRPIGDIILGSLVENTT